MESESPARYLATIHTPGYLPMDDDPPTFETAQAAWQWLRDEHAMGWNDVDVPGDPDDMLPEPYRSQYQDTDALLREIAERPDVADMTGTIYGPTPGYDGDHDLGLAYSVMALEDSPYRTAEPLAVVSMVSTTKYGTVTTGKVTHPAEQLADGTVIYLSGHDWHDASPTIRATFREQTS